MAFWGVEVKPGRPFTHIHDPSAGRLRITQATVGSGSSAKKVILQCNVGKKSPVLLCSLIPDKAESCRLDLEFEEEDDVLFSVIGPRSVHLAGYNMGYGKAGGDDGDSDSYGEDIGETETDESGSFDSGDEYEDDFIDDDGMEMYDSDPSLRPNSGVVIEEIIEDDKQASGAKNSHSSKKSSLEGSDDGPKSERQIVKSNHQMDLESEDEDGFPIFPSRKHKSSTESNGAEKDIAHGNLSQEKLNVDISAVSGSTGKNQEQHEKTDKSSPEKIEKTQNKKEKLKKRKKNKIKKTVAESEENILADKSKDDDSKDETECDDKEANAVDINPINIEEQNHTTVKEVGTSSNIDETAEIKASKKKIKKKRSKEKISGEAEGAVRLNEHGGDNIQDTYDRSLLNDLKKQKDEDRLKGLAVKNQKFLWHRSLEFRFLLQKAFSSSNKLPKESARSSYCDSDNSVNEAFSDFITSAKYTLSCLTELQEALIEKNPAIDQARLASNGVSTDLEDQDDEDLRRILKTQCRFAPFRDNAIDKWHRKAQVTTGAAAFKGKLHAFNQNISEQVATYMRDPNRMINRMQLTRSTVGVFGEVSGNVGDRKEEEANMEGDAELLDDSEFYQQLLKEFFESCDLASSESAYYAVKKLHTKKRKTVDRRASKSRRIRYNVHEKIVNFMAPKPMDCNDIASKLFENLFGLRSQKPDTGV